MGNLTFLGVGEVVSPEKPGGVRDEEITVPKSVGLATGDMAVAATAHAMALESEAGREA